MPLLLLAWRLRLRVLLRLRWLRARRLGCAHLRLHLRLRARRLGRADLWLRLRARRLWPRLCSRASFFGSA
jgi:hypothetical protein